VKRIEAKSPEEIAKQIGLETADDLRDLIRKSMEERLEYAQREKIRDQISKLLTESADWALPPDLLRRQSRREIERSTIELRSSGFSESEITARLNRLRKNILERTEILLKEHFILERIAEEEKVEDEPMDYEIEIARIAAQKNDSPRRVRAKLERSGQMDAMRNMIIERKVVALITEHAKFKGTGFKIDEDEDTSALDFFAAGNSDAIPEAKYEESLEHKPLSVPKERD
jgi:trigger factor